MIVGYDKGISGIQPTRLWGCVMHMVSYDSPIWIWVIWGMNMHSVIRVLTQDDFRQSCFAGAFARIRSWTLRPIPRLHLYILSKTLPRRPASTQPSKHSKQPHPLSKPYCVFDVFKEFQGQVQRKPSILWIGIRRGFRWWLECSRRFHQ